MSIDSISLCCSAENFFYIRLTDEDYANDNYDLISQTIQDVDYLISKPYLE